MLYVYFEEYEEDREFLTYPLKLVETVSGSITLLESKMAWVPHMCSVEEMITVTIQDMADFRWIGSFGSLHYLKTVDGFVRDVMRIAIPWVKQTKRSVSEASRQRATKRKIKILLQK